MEYMNSLSVLEGRNLYFAQNGFSEAGYTEKFSKIRLGCLYYYIPNSKGRAEAIRMHDLHHVLNNYGTDLAGEAEIGAWELASGIPGKYAYGIFLDSVAALIGLFLRPNRVLKAYLRGR